METPHGTSGHRMNPVGVSLPQFPRPLPPRAKRTKINLACSNCRDRKTKCDGGRPTCAACGRRGVASSCAYERAPPPARRQPSELENPTQQHGQADQTDQLAQTSNIGDNIASDPLEPAISQRANRVSTWMSNEAATPHDSDKSLSGTGSAHGQGPHRVDALATISSEENDDYLYGGSSTIAFVRQVASGSVADDNASLNPTHERFQSHAPLQDHLATPILPLDLSIGKNENLAVLPLRRHADDFLQCFWEFVHPLFPILHKPSFMKHYDNLWLPNAMPLSDEAEVIFTSNLNLAFALGCQLSSCVPPTQKTSVANEFYKKSKHVLLYDVLGSTSITVVQWLLLSGIYLQSTSHASHCWNSIGLAIRLAQGLGLHHEGVGRKAGSQVDREMKRRIWHTCVVLDRLLGMTFGRPLMVNKSYSTPIPSLIDDDYLQRIGEGMQPLSIPSRLGLFAYSCRLFEILADILFSFYADSTNGHHESIYTQDMIVDVLKFNRRLDSFTNAIPEYLRTDRTVELTLNEKNSYINLQQQVLYCRFLYTRLLSLRPLLLMATNGSNSMKGISTRSNQSSFDDELVRHSCQLCVNTAHSLIETIHQHLDTTYKSTGWHSVYFTFASATILLASIRLPDLIFSNGDNFQISWDRCLTIMKHYEDQIHTASYAVKVLQTLRQQVRRSDTQEPQHADTLREGFAFSEDRGADNLPTPEMLFDPSLTTLDLSQFNPYGTESLSEAWFSQHVINLDGMDFTQDYS